MIPIIHKKAPNAFIEIEVFEALLSGVSARIRFFVSSVIQESGIGAPQFMQTGLLPSITCPHFLHVIFILLLFIYLADFTVLQCRSNCLLGQRWQAYREVLFHLFAALQVLLLSFHFHLVTISVSF